MEESVDLWRILLRKFIDAGGPDAKFLLADELKVTVRTIDRYLTGISKPDSKRKLNDLEEAIPGIGPALRQSFRQFYASLQDTVSQSVAPFYARVHQLLRTIDEAEVLREVTHLVLDLLVKQVDTEKSGFVAILGQLGSVDGDKKASHITMYARSAHGTGIWQEMSLQHSYDVGAGSLCALAIQSPAFYPRDCPLISAPSEIMDSALIQSAAAYPIERFGRIAGVIFMASTQLNYFNDYRREVIGHYACMISLAFHECDFYAKDHIDLAIIGPDDIAERQYLLHLASLYPNDTTSQLKERAILRLSK